MSKPIVTKAQRRVLEELYAMTGPFGYSPEAELARRLGMSEYEVRQHLRALAKLGLASDSPRTDQATRRHL